MTTGLGDVERVQFAIRAVVYLGDTLDHALAGHGDTLAIATYTYEGRAPGEDRDDVFLRFFAGCLSFLEQRITTSEQRPASRGLRRQLARERFRYFDRCPKSVSLNCAGDSTRVTMTTFQQVLTVPAGTTNGSSQVTGAGSITQDRMLTSALYIAPYVKGPADKPLKAPAGDVFAVTR